MLTPRAVVCVAACALLAQACVYRWRPVDLATPGADWARRIERADASGASYVATRRTRLVDAPGEDATTAAEIAADARVQIEGDAIHIDGALLERPGARFAEVSYIDPGLTALNAIVWSLAGSATAWGAAFFAVMMSIVSGDCRCAPTR